MISKFHTTLVVVATIVCHFRRLSLMREEIRIEVAVLRVIAIIFLSYLEVAMASVAVDVGSTSRGIASASSVPFPLLLSAYLVLTAREVV